MSNESVYVQKISMADTIKGNVWLIALIALGWFLVFVGLFPFNVTFFTIGVALIATGFVGVYMMLTTRQVAKQLHIRFNGTNDILDTHTVILKEMASSQKEMASSQKEMASSQKEMASSQKENHSDMMAILKEIVTSLKKIEKKP